MRGTRGLSQAISEGDGISLLADVGDAGAAGTAEGEGAEGVIVRRAFEGLRDATGLPILWCPGSAAEASRAGADAYLLVLDGLDDDDGELERRHAETLELGLDCVVEVRNEDELQLALDRVDPEIFLLSGRSAAGVDPLEHVLSLLSDVPAGKLAIAEVEGAGAGEVSELERAGIDAVIVRTDAVAELVGDPAPDF